MPIQSKNPATEEVVKTFEEISEAELEAKLAKAHSAFVEWKTTTFAEREALVRKLGLYLREHAEELAVLAAIEMGKTMLNGIAEVEKCALTCDYYADNAENILAHEIFKTTASEAYAQFDPLGVVLAVMPWNFPFWQVFRFAAPALMAGNVGILKHASNVPQCAEAIERAFIECGFPDGAFQNLLLSASRVESVIRDPRIAAVTLTGSEKAGSDVARIAGEEIKKTVLELGGSDPYIILADADIALAAETAALARIQNNAGQSCVAAKRFIVHESVAEEFTKLFVKQFEALVVGDPLAPETHVGPLANEQGLREVMRQVDESVAKGATIACGGKRVGERGYFYEPTILTGVKKGMPVYDEEVFGPVAPVITFSNEDEAITIANDTPYGLGAAIFTADIAKAKKLITRIDAGNVFVNTMVRSDPRTPFGGIKKSGFGRELSHYGIKEFVNIKNVLIK